MPVISKLSLKPADPPPTPLIFSILKIKITVFAVMGGGGIKTGRELYLRGN